MNVASLINNTEKIIKRNAPEILSAIAVSGVFSTAYLASKASIEAADIVRADEATDGTHADAMGRFKERFKHTWRLYIPTAVSGVVTVGCIIGAGKASSQKTAAAVAAYSLSERAFSEYKEKVVEHMGVNKEQAVRDEIAQDKVSRNKITGARETIIVGGAQVLCLDLTSGRYIRSDMESLRKAENKINSMIFSEPYVSLNEFYELIGMTYTSRSGGLGWEAPRLMELDITTTLADNDEPCLAFDFNYLKPL